EPAIKIGGKATTRPPVKLQIAAEEEDEEEEEDEVEEEEEGEEAAATEQVAAAVGEPRFRPPRKPKSERETVMEELDAASRTEEVDEYELPSIELLMPSEEICYEEHEKEVRRQAKILEKTFGDFGFK